MSKSIKFKNNTYLDSNGIVHNKELLNTLLDRGIFKEYTGNLSGNTSYDVNLFLPQFSIVSILLIQGVTAEIIEAFTANYTGYFFTPFLKQTIANSFLDKIERGSNFLRLTIKNTNNVQYRIKVLTL